MQEMEKSKENNVTIEYHFLIQVVPGQEIVEVFVQLFAGQNFITILGLISSKFNIWVTLNVLY